AAMIADEIKTTYIGGPTALFEIAGLRFLTDPTFDPKDSEYRTNVYTLHKLKAPAITPDKLGKIDFVLLSHDHHFDNLDNAGRKLLSEVTTVYTTTAGAERLGGNAVGIAHWQTIDVPAKDGRILNITGTPGRHGPVGGDRGPVTGFVLNFKGEDKGGIYISGDTVWYEGVEEVALRFDIRMAVLFMGAARVKEVGPQHLTMTAEEGVLAARYFPRAKIVPLHFEGWEHFTESYAEIKKTFVNAGIADRLHWPGNE
ncbi:MAG TPA: MBL fold metallo-hydrolase, partial [Chitinophagaceae bacterium]|nr:MBL fold metallo-hydrolase [Chitinophagaceae bacterium]